MMKSRKDEYTKHALLWACCILFINLLSKAFFYTDAPFTLDESFTFYYSKFSVKEIIQELIRGNNPPLYEIFMHFWTEIFGNSIWVLRLPSLLFTALFPALWYLIVRKVESHKIALFVSLVFSFLQAQWLFSQEMRAYAMAFFLISASIFVLGFKWKYNVHLILSAILLALAVYTHYFSIFALPLAYWFIIKKSSIKNSVSSIGIFSIVFGILLVPVVLIVVGRIFDSENVLWGIKPNWKQLYGQFNIAFNYRLWYALALVLLGFFFNDIRRSLRLQKLYPEKWRWDVFFLFVYVGIYFVLFIISQFRPVFIAKYLSFVFLGIIPLACILLGKIFTKSNKGIYFLVAIFAIFLSGLKWVSNTEYNPRRVVRVMDEYLSENLDVTILVYPSWYQYSIAYHKGYYDLTPYQINGALVFDNIYCLDDGFQAKDKVQESSAILYIDAGEEFLDGNHPIRDILLKEKRLLRHEQIDNQVQTWYFAN